MYAVWCGSVVSSHSLLASLLQGKLVRIKLGIAMKIRHLLGTFVILIITIYFVAAGIAGAQNQVSAENITIDKAIPSISIQQTLNPGDQFEQDRSIFSKTTLISLLVAVIGIVAFRRNNYS